MFLILISFIFNTLHLEDVALVTEGEEEMEVEGMVSTVVDVAVVEMAGIEEDLTINEKLLKELKRKDPFTRL
uniref:Uncharacterized protein n=1 Tax=Meloidogyne enterolobii TaxID=390850 RepID=A0A6V7TU93_MELEN|nr:unnamed protein product [Meloidogyne enterolobii]